MRIPRKLAALTGAIVATMAFTGVAAAAELNYARFGETEVVGPDTVRLISDLDLTEPYGGLDFNLPGASIAFTDIEVLSTTAFADSDDTCVGGSPRFQINVDTNGDGNADANAFAYVELAPGICPPGGATGNLAQTGGLGDIAGRWDTSQLVAGTQVSTYTATLLLFQLNPTWTVVGIQLVVDSYWAFADNEQAVTVSPDVEVRMAEPTSKDECKNGGWQGLAREGGSTFKNQGDCIQYVNTGK